MIRRVAGALPAAAIIPLIAIFLVLNRSVAELSRETGGGYFVLRQTADIEAIVPRIIAELRSSYVLGFVPAVLDGKFHDVKVVVSDPKATVLVKKRYLAQADK